MEVLPDDDEILGYDQPLVSEAQEISLASRDSLALVSKYKSRKATPIQEEALEHKLPGERARRRRKKAVALTVFLLVCVAIILSITLTTRERNRNVVLADDKSNAIVEEQSTTNTASLEPSSSPFSAIQQSLEFQIISAKVEQPELLLDFSSPQGMAFQQILSEGRTDPFRIVQRFALMMLFFSTGGDNWEFKHGWRDFDDDECRWMGVELCRMQDHGGLAVGEIEFGKNAKQPRVIDG